MSPALPDRLRQLLTSPGVVPTAAAEQLWQRALTAEPWAANLRSTLVERGIPAEREPARTQSALLLPKPALTLESSSVRTVIAEATAGRGAIPEVVKAARSFAVQAQNPLLLDDVRTALWWCTPGHDAIAWCRKHDLAPPPDADPVRRAEYYLMVGDHARYQAVDPDSTHLAASYRLGSGAHQQQVRRFLAEFGEVDVARVLAAKTTAQDVPASRTERDALRDALAKHHDWPQLWRYAARYPTGEALEAIRRIPADWEPQPADAVVFARLRDLAGRTSLGLPASLAEWPGWSMPWPAPTGLDDLPSRRTASLSPDGSRLAVVDGDSVCDLSDPDRGPARAGRSPSLSRTYAVLHLGTALLAAERDTLRHRLLVVRAGEENRMLAESAYPWTIGRTRTGFAASDGARVLLGEADDEILRPIGDACRLVATDPDLGRLLVFLPEKWLAVYDDAGVLLAFSDHRVNADDGAFASTDRLATLDTDPDTGATTLTSWRVDGTHLLPEASRAGEPGQLFPMHVDGSIGLGTSRALRYLDPVTLAGTDVPEAAARYYPEHHGHLVAQHARGLTVHRPLLRGLGRVALAQPGSAAELPRLTAARTALGAHPDPEVAALVEAMIVQREYLFGTEIALGTGVGPSVRLDDIAISFVEDL